MKKYIRLRMLLIGWLGMGVNTSPAPAAEYRVSSAADVEQVSGKLQPGDVMVMSDGVWKDQAVTFGGRGTAEKPIRLRAETPGKVVLVGESSVVIDGEQLVASGLYVKDGGSGTDGIAIKGRHCRLTDTAMIGGTYKFFIHMYGSENRVDHCYVAGKTSGEPTFQVETESQPNHHRVDHNHFGPRPPLGRNGGETMRVGYSWQSMSNSCTVVESNLFDRCDGEIEIISSKSCENVYRGNTFLDCAGMLTLRHGNRCLVEGNFFLGHHKRGAGGIRVIGEDHKIINNYFEAVDQGGFWVTSGIPDSPLKGYFRARGCLIAFNTVIDCRGPCVEVNAGFGTSGRSLPPKDITVANNIFSVPEHGTLLKGTGGEGYVWLGNMAVSAAMMAEHEGIKQIDPKLQRAVDGLWRPAPDSPVKGAAEGNFQAIRSDIDGQEREARWDVGCDQASKARITNRPLTAADVGPAWLDRSGPAESWVREANTKDLR
jgi:poly(beta-D-mannuronate) lyase